MVTPFPIERLEPLVNGLLRTNPEFADITSRLAGRLLAIQVAGVRRKFIVLAEPERVTVLTDTEVAPDVLISGNLPALGAYLLGIQYEISPSVGQVSVEGSAVVAQDFQRLFQGVELDLEEWLAGRVGDIGAHRAAKAARAVSSTFLDTGASLVHNLGDALQYELGVTPAREEFDLFSEQVAELVADIDRLAKGLSKLAPDTE